MTTVVPVPSETKRWGPSERFACVADSPDHVELVKYATEDCGGIVLSRLRFDRGQCLSGLSSGDAPSGTPGPFAPPNSELQSDFRKVKKYSDNRRNEKKRFY